MGLKDKKFNETFFKNTLIVLALSITSALGFSVFIASFPQETTITQFQLPLIIGFIFMNNMFGWLMLQALGVFEQKTQKNKEFKTDAAEVIERYIGDKNE